MLIANALLMIGIAVAAAVVVRRITHARWGLWGLGAVAFVISQVVHLPILWGWHQLTESGALPGMGATADAIVLGVLAAGCEEPARAFVFRAAMTERGRNAALMVGAGHGGVEAVILGALALLGAINVTMLADATPADLEARGLTADAADAAIDQVQQALAMPWYEVIGGAFERAITVPFHIACSVLVMAAIRRRRAGPFIVAFAAHAIVDASIGLLREVGQSGWLLELELAGMSVPFTVAALLWTRRMEPADASR